MDQAGCGGNKAFVYITAHRNSQARKLIGWILGLGIVAQGLAGIAHQQDGSPHAVPCASSPRGCALLS